MGVSVAEHAARADVHFRRRSSVLGRGSHAPAGAPSSRRIRVQPAPGSRHSMPTSIVAVSLPPLPYEIERRLITAGDCAPVSASGGVFGRRRACRHRLGRRRQQRSMVGLRLHSVGRCAALHRHGRARASVRSWGCTQTFQRWSLSQRGRAQTSTRRLVTSAVCSSTSDDFETRCNTKDQDLKLTFERRPPSADWTVPVNCIATLSAYALLILNPL